MQQEQKQDSSCSLNQSEQGLSISSPRCQNSWIKSKEVSKKSSQQAQKSQSHSQYISGEFKSFQSEFILVDKNQKQFKAVFPEDGQNQFYSTNKTLDYLYLQAKKQSYINQNLHSNQSDPNENLNSEQSDAKFVLQEISHYSFGEIEQKSQEFESGSISIVAKDEPSMQKNIQNRYEFLQFFQNAQQLNFLESISLNKSQIVKRYSLINNSKNFIYNINNEPNFYFNYLYALDLSDLAINVSRLTKLNWKNLIILNLSDCKIDNDGWNNLASSIHKYQDLKHIFLNNNKIRSISEEQLARFSILQYLQFVDLWDNKFLTPQSIFLIKKVQKQNKIKGKFHLGLFWTESKQWAMDMGLKEEEEASDIFQFQTPAQIQQLQASLPTELSDFPSKVRQSIRQVFRFIHDMNGYQIFNLFTYWIFQIKTSNQQISFNLLIEKIEQSIEHVWNRKINIRDILEKMQLFVQQTTDPNIFFTESLLYKMAKYIFCTFAKQTLVQSERNSVKKDKYSKSITPLNITIMKKILKFVFNDIMPNTQCFEYFSASQQQKEQLGPLKKQKSQEQFFNMLEGIKKISLFMVEQHQYQSQK